MNVISVTLKQSDRLGAEVWVFWVYHRVDNSQKLQVPLDLPLPHAMVEEDADHEGLLASQKARQSCHQALRWKHFCKLSLF
jgi:hypothetical protein